MEVSKLTAANVKLALIAVVASGLSLMLVVVIAVFGFTAFLRVVEENDINRTKAQLYEAKVQEYQRDKKEAEVWQAVLRYLKARDGNSSTN